MKTVVSVSLGASRHNYELKLSFLGKQFKVKRIGTDGDVERAEELILEWDEKADAIGLGSIKFPYTIGPKHLIEKNTQRVMNLGSKIKTPVTTGSALRNVAFEWAIRHIQFMFKNYFTNARTLILSGLTNYNLAKILDEYTENLTFADPLFENGVPKFLNSLKELELYANNIQGFLKWIPTKNMAAAATPISFWNEFVLRKAMQKAHVIMVPYHDFYRHLGGTTIEELGGKIIITSTAYDDRIQFVKERGADVLIDCTPKIGDRVVGVNVIEAIILAALGKQANEMSDDDILEIISDNKLEPRIVYPQNKPRQTNRFAFVIHPLSTEDFKKEKKLKAIANIAPEGVFDVLEKAMAYSPPFIYSKVEGVKSPLGVEAEGWLISVGGTPKQMLAHTPEFTYKRLLQAAKLAKRLGAKIMGLGAFTKVVGDAGVTVSRQADIPITTGNSYSASGALWAAADAVRRMGLIKYEKGKKIKAKTMVVGATGAIGSVCCRLLALAFKELYMVGRNTAKLLALQESILGETPDVNIHLSTRADHYIEDMDVIVTTTSGAGKKVLDITNVKPGCVITDVARPLDLKPEDVRMRPDVLYIESGEIELPGNPKLKNIGLPPKVVYACLAETIVLALEGRYEIFTVGRDIEWEKVKEIYKLGIKHGMKLAAISGVDGVYSDEDIQAVTDRALAERKKRKKTAQN